MNELDETSDVSYEEHMGLSDEEQDEIHSLNGSQYTFREEETKSRFTEYSMSSSVMRRNEQLTLLDDKFETVNIHQYKIFTYLIYIYINKIYCYMC